MNRLNRLLKKGDRHLATTQDVGKNAGCSEPVPVFQRTLSREMALATDRGLERLVEPLASFICATEQPSVSLSLALDVLLSQVDQLNRAASAFVGCSSEPHGLC